MHGAERTVPVVARLIAVVALLAIVPACGSQSAERGPDDVGADTGGDSDINMNPSADAGAPNEPDAGTDAGTDTDAGSDPGTDAGPDAGDPDSESFCGGAVSITVNDIPEQMNGTHPFTNNDGELEDYRLLVPQYDFTIDVRWTGDPTPPAGLTITATAALGATTAGTDLTPLFTQAGRHLRYLVAETHAVVEGVVALAANVDGEPVCQLSLRVLERTFQRDPFPLGETWVLEYSHDWGSTERVAAGDFFAVVPGHIKNGVPDFQEDLQSVGLGTSSMLPQSAAVENNGVVGTNAIVERRVRNAVLARVREVFLQATDGTMNEESIPIVFFDEDDPGAPDPDAFVAQLLQPTDTEKGFSFIAIGGGNQSYAIGGSDGDRTNNYNSNNDSEVWPANMAKYITMLAQEDPTVTGAFVQWLFGPFVPELGLGGIPIGESPLDAVILAPDPDPAAFTPDAELRLSALAVLTEIIAINVARTTAHEIGHCLGLVAGGPPPFGLFGGERLAEFTGPRTNDSHIDTAGFNVMAAGPGSGDIELALEPNELYTQVSFNPLHRAHLQRRLIVLSDWLPNP